MKTRMGFVSNSSSSSFICDVCGNVESGYDLSAREAGFYRCLSGHEFCESHLIGVELDVLKENIVTAIREENANSLAHGWGKIGITEEEVFSIEEEEKLINLFLKHFDEVPDMCCPICSLETIRNNDLLNYVLKMSNISKDKLTEQLKQDHPTFEGLMEFLYGDGK